MTVKNNALYNLADQYSTHYSLKQAAIYHKGWIFQTLHCFVTYTVLTHYLATQSNTNVWQELRMVTLKKICNKV